METAGPAEGRNEGRIDYKEVLSAPEFERFARLRLLRKELAEKEGVPAYAIFTNEQLAQAGGAGNPKSEGRRPKAVRSGRIAIA